MMAPTLSPGAGAAAGGSLVAERNASLASCLVRSTNASCCDASTGTHRTWSCGAGCQPARRLATAAAPCKRAGVPSGSGPLRRSPSPDPPLGREGIRQPQAGVADSPAAPRHRPPPGRLYRASSSSQAADKPLLPRKRIVLRDVRQHLPLRRGELVLERLAVQ